MTNKTLSQQICKICGIKKKRVQDFTCNKCKYLINNECERGDNPCNNYKYVYPDFKNNNNFVKLLEIYFDCKNIKKIILNSILDDFMQDKTNNDLSIDYYYSDLTEKCEKFKQAIKNEDWEV